MTWKSKLEKAAENECDELDAHIAQAIGMSHQEYTKIKCKERFKAGAEFARAEMMTEAQVLVEALKVLNKRVGSIPFSNADKWGDVLEYVYGLTNTAVDRYQKGTSDD